jgi:hypothetical protein
MNEGIYPVDQVGDKLASLRRIIFGSELNYIGYLPKLGRIKKRGIKGRKEDRKGGQARFVRVYCASCPDALAFTWPVCRYTVPSVAKTARPVSIGEDDSLAYPHRLGEALKESGCALHAYVLLSNPGHLLLTSPHPRHPPAHHLVRARLRGVHQQNLSPHRHAVGQPLHVLTGARRHLLTAVPTLYRAQPRTCRHGGRPGALPLEQLP